MASSTGAKVHVTRLTGWQGSPQKKWKSHGCLLLGGHSNPKNHQLNYVPFKMNHSTQRDDCSNKKITSRKLQLHEAEAVTLPETSSSPLQIGRAPKGNDCIPTIHFQVLLLLVSGSVVLCLTHVFLDHQIFRWLVGWNATQVLGLITAASSGTQLVGPGLGGWTYGWVPWTSGEAVEAVGFFWWPWEVFGW